jgi:hypothetical protein
MASNNLKNSSQTHNQPNAKIILRLRSIISSKFNGKNKTPYLEELINTQIIFFCRHNRCKRWFSLTIIEIQYFSLSSLKLGIKKIRNIEFGIKIYLVLKFKKLKGPNIYNWKSLGTTLNIHQNFVKVTHSLYSPSLLTFCVKSQGWLNKKLVTNLVERRIWTWKDSGCKHENGIVQVKNDEKRGFLIRDCQPYSKAMIFFIAMIFSKLHGN